MASGTSAPGIIVGRRGVLCKPGRLVVLLLVVGLAAPSCASRSSEAGDSVVVVEAIDGGTIEVVFGSTTERVRLLGIDAPESVHPSVPVQCFGPEASSALARLLPPGTEIEVFRDEQLRDHFGRLLLYVYRSNDSLNINRYLVEHGLAAATFYEPNLHFRSEITGAEQRAKSQQVGLWGSCDGPDQPLQ